MLQAALAHRACPKIEIERLLARLHAAEHLIDVVRARDIGTAGGVGAAFAVYDAQKSIEKGEEDSMGARHE